jgi:hypothetical protein
LVAIALLVVACGGSGDGSLLTTPKPGSITPGASASVLPFGAPFIEAPAPLRGVASTYYDGGGPAPQEDDRFRPACMLMLPTSLHAAPLRPTPAARFNDFDEFEVTWRLADGRGTGLALFLYPPGDPSDREFFFPDAQVTALADGTELRRTPQRPRATLVRVPTQNCEYEVEGRGTFPATALETAVRSLRLVYAP